MSFVWLIGSSVTLNNYLLRAPCFWLDLQFEMDCFNGYLYYCKSLIMNNIEYSTKVLLNVN